MSLTARTSRLLVSVATVVAISGVAGSAGARDMAGYEVTGEARQSDSNARTRALDHAFAQAVKQALKKVLTPDMRSKHAATLRDKIVRRARKHVVSYRVHKQRVVEGKLQVKVGVLIDRDKLRGALKQLGIDSTRATATPSVATRPKVMVLLHSTVHGKTHVTYGNALTGRDGGAAGKAFIAELKRRGFDVLITKDPPPVSRNADAGLPLDDTAATAMAKKAAAGGVAIVGIEVTSGGVIRGTKLKGATGRAVIRLLDVVKGKLVARATVSGAGFGPDAGKAAANAASTVGGKAVGKIGGAAERYWPTTPAITDGVAILVRGAIHWVAVAGLLRTLRAATDVKTAELRRFRPGEIALVVRGAITNLDKTAAVKRAAAILNSSNLGAYSVKTAPEGTNTLAVTIAATKGTP